MLEYLNLKGNRITVVENLSHLKNLSYLDLGENLIKTLSVEELPKSLNSLSFIGNSVTDVSGF